MDPVKNILGLRVKVDTRSKQRDINVGCEKCGKTFTIHHWRPRKMLDDEWMCPSCKSVDLAIVNRTNDKRQHVKKEENNESD